MSAVNITNVTVLDNPASFLTPFQFEISYECVTPLKDDLEWKLIYVGSAEDETYDQLLESVLVGPVNVGNYRFVLQADPPDPSKIREEDIIGVTLREEPPPKVLIDKVQRNILSDKPRVTKFPINFHPENGGSGEQSPSLDQQPTETDVDGEQPSDLPTNPSDEQVS
ncbi:histone chaperone ASF1B isoform X2 [Rhodamnia argentea]|uniref:Histone chaperone ASF1B isoform X2 n=1 Tax=Rhodamnia argentea TaxID=178133 RepID=A0A8B8NUV2_9MYRT|nr:histone chaperone ASF1B isoform X2 [Rhodamnia argentea]